jgi:hypothetical protein
MNPNRTSFSVTSTIGFVSAICNEPKRYVTDTDFSTKLQGVSVIDQDGAEDHVP